MCIAYTHIYMYIMCRLKDVIILMLNKSGKVKNKNKKTKKWKNNYFVLSFYLSSKCTPHIEQPCSYLPNTGKG